jgi:hypothetical protein
VEAESLKPAIELLDQIINDRTVPKNIRRVVEESKNSLNDENMQPEVRISTAIHLLDEIINDPNMPLYTRTKIWNIMSILEQIRRTLKS